MYSPPSFEPNASVYVFPSQSPHEMSIASGSSMNFASGCVSWIASAV